jgi:hypothetical protein
MVDLENVIGGIFLELIIKIVVVAGVGSIKLAEKPTSKEPTPTTAFIMLR